MKKNVKNSDFKSSVNGGDVDVYREDSASIEHKTKSLKYGRKICFQHKTFRWNYNFEARLVYAIGTDCLLV